MVVEVRLGGWCLACRSFCGAFALVPAFLPPVTLRGHFRLKSKSPSNSRRASHVELAMPATPRWTIHTRAFPVGGWVKDAFSSDTQKLEKKEPSCPFILLNMLCQSHLKI